MNTNERVRDGIIGLFVGDAVGVPYEFQNRQEIAAHPATDMIGYGTHNQPPGTWSDDSTMTYCLLYSLIMHPQLNTDDLGRRFIQWYRQGLWTAHDELFDIGIATRQAIAIIESGTVPVEEAGGTDEYSNGNGSLMRILPLVYRLDGLDIATRYEWVRRVSSLTHRHPVSLLAGVIYIELGLELLHASGRSIADCYAAACQTIQMNYAQHAEYARFERVVNGSLTHASIEEISSSGYVLHTMEASIWTLLHTDHYEDAVLKAVNLGLDTDTTGAVTGGLAGIYYGYEQIPAHWRKQLVRREEIEEVCERFAATLSHAGQGGA
ncbi:ADP-ribosylglycohydrolase family protein [Paenibacillus sp. WLX1005]|uniref:ADP-ribosylglycohydrolase family protein n=1 Tax=Paenibacillus sp. WLX1005 TaxID=3243766 RepID=UPI003984558D